MLRRFAVCATLTCTTLAAQDSAAPAKPTPPATPDMQPYAIPIGDDLEIPMQPIPVGSDGFPAHVTLGSPAEEAGRKADEGPQVQVELEPFWIGKFEITWDVFDAFRRDYQQLAEGALRHGDASAEDWADAVSLPTPLYEQDAAPILAGMGSKGGYPVANISQFAARQFTKWLSRRSGVFHRLPTEAEWEYAARGGTTTAWSFGDDPAELDAHAVYFDNSAYDDVRKGHPDFGAGYRKVGSKQPNPFGLFDMHGNVAEWVIDRYAADWYAQLAAAAEGEPLAWRDAIAWPSAVFPCVARGGSWDAEAAGCRSAARLASSADWQERDPQFPKSIWWFTDGFHVGFRIVRPLRTPSPEQQLRYWESADEGTQDVLQSSGKELRAKVPSSGGDGR